MTGCDIKKLVAYGVDTGLVPPEDVVYTTNRLLELFGMDEPTECNAEGVGKEELEALLGRLCDRALEMGLIPDDTVTCRDLFDTKVMDLLMPRPSEVIRRFRELYEASPEAATDYYYKLSCDSNYIRRYRIRKDVKWV